MDEPLKSKTKELRLSSSVILLRRRNPDTVDTVQDENGFDFEVLLAQRSSKLKSFSSAFVFPGGVTEEHEDQSLAEKFRGDGETMEEITVAKMTGIRELFEEAGVLLTTSNPKHHARPVVLEHEEQKAWQKKVHDDARDFRELLNKVGQPPAMSALHYWVTFVTPVFEKRRFRTHFYLAVVDDCDINLDGGETVRFIWTTPRDALKLNHEGKMPFLPPQFYILSALAEFGKVEDLLTHARVRPRLLPIQPHAVGSDEQDRMLLAYPGDYQHPIYAGKDGHLRRVACKMPFGKGGYEFITNLLEEPNEENWPGEERKKAKL